MEHYDTEEYLNKLEKVVAILRILAWESHPEVNKLTNYELIERFKEAS